MNKDIDKAAREYAEHLYRSCFDDLGEPIPAEIDLRLTKLASDYENFAAGLHFCKSEIDELIEALSDLKAAVESYDEQDEISIKIYEFVLDKATQLLEKYGKK